MLTFADLSAATGVPNKVLHDWKRYGLLRVRGDLNPGAGNGGHHCDDAELRVLRALIAVGIQTRGGRTPQRRALLAAIAHGVRHARPEWGRWLIVLHTDNGPEIWHGDDHAAATHSGPRTLIPLWD